MKIKIKNYINFTTKFKLKQIVYLLGDSIKYEPFYIGAIVIFDPGQQPIIIKDENLDHKDANFLQSNIRDLLNLSTNNKSFIGKKKATYYLFSNYGSYRWQQEHELHEG